MSDGGRESFSSAKRLFTWLLFESKLAHQQVELVERKVRENDAVVALLGVLRAWGEGVSKQL